MKGFFKSLVSMVPVLKAQGTSYNVYSNLSTLFPKKKWLGQLDSNQRMTVPKTVALPLGYGPILNGGPDGTRTRDLLRDRQAF